MAKIVNFRVCIFYHNKKNWKKRTESNVEGIHIHGEGVRNGAGVVE